MVVVRAAPKTGGDAIEIRKDGAHRFDRRGQLLAERRQDLPGVLGAAMLQRAHKLEEIHALRQVLLTDGSHPKLPTVSNRASIPDLASLHPGYLLTTPSADCARLQGHPGW